MGRILPQTSSLALSETPTYFPGHIHEPPVYWRCCAPQWTTPGTAPSTHTAGAASWVGGETSEPKSIWRARLCTDTSANVTALHLKLTVILRSATRRLNDPELHYNLNSDRLNSTFGSLNHLLLHLFSVTSSWRECLCFFASSSSACSSLIWEISLEDWTREREWEDVKRLTEMHCVKCKVVPVQWALCASSWAHWGLPGPPPASSAGPPFHAAAGPTAHPPGRTRTEERDWTIRIKCPTKCVISYVCPPSLLQFQFDSLSKVSDWLAAQIQTGEDRRW